MPNEMTVSGISRSGESGNNNADQRMASPAATRSAPSRPPEVYANPTLRLDAGLGMVVIEFRDGSGNIASSIPTERQLEAYRMNVAPNAQAVSEADKRGAGEAPQPGGV